MVYSVLFFGWVNLARRDAAGLPASRARMSAAVLPAANAVLCAEGTRTLNSPTHLLHPLFHAE